MSLCCLAAVAQNVGGYALAERDISGTARYVSMAGAMAAVGGDVAAVTDNAAALGVFRRGELSLSLDWQHTAVRQGSLAEAGNRFRLPQLSWVVSFGNNQRQSGMLFNNLLFQYQRLKTYNRTTACAGRLPVSQTDIMASLTNGLLPADFDTGTDVWDNPDIGWLSVVGVDCGVIRADTLSDHQRWYSVLEPDEQVLADVRRTESGAVDQYTFAWAANISNRCWLGLSLNMHTLAYTKRTDYAETFSRGGGYTCASTLTATGIGFDAAIGIIWKPLRWLRLAAAFRSPAWMTLRLDNYTGYLDVLSPSYTQSFDNWRSPMQLTAGVALQFGAEGMLSLEYDYRRQPGGALPDEHTFKLGGEYVLHGNWFFRAGYAVRPAIGGYDFRFLPSNVDTRTDTDFRNLRSTHYAGLGAGFRNRRWILDIAYQYAFDRSAIFAHALQQTPFDVTTSTHRIVISLGWTRRR